MKTSSLICASLLLLSLGTNVAAQEIYRCNGVYRNQACGASERGGLVQKLPRINRIDYEYPRASLNVDALPQAGADPIRSRSISIAPRTSRSDNNLSALHLDIVRLSEIFNKREQNKGSANMQNQVTHYFTRAQIACSEVTGEGSEKDLCQSMLEQLQKIQVQLASS